MKKKSSNYSEISNRAIYQLNKNNEKLPYATRWLYVHLNFLENKFTNDKQKDGFFIHTLKELSVETGITNKTLINSIRSLEKARLLETWQSHWLHKDGKKSRKHMTAFRLLDV